MRACVSVLGAVFAALLLPVSAAPAQTPLDARAADGLRETDVFIDPEVANLIDRERIAFAASTASRAIDGEPVKFAFVNVPDDRLNGFRDRLFSRLDLGERGALIVATPVSVAVRTRTLRPDTEAAIVARDGEPIAAVPRRYTEPLAELVYDVGLVIHNSTPGVIPRGDGPNRDLKTFTGEFAGEGTSVPVAILIFAAAIGLLVSFGIATLRGVARMRRLG